MTQKQVAGSTDRSEAVREPNIVQLLPAGDDWFAVTGDYIREDKQYQYFIERVICWALIRNSGQIDHVKAIDFRGIAPDGDEWEDVQYVRGCDSSPYGQTWKSIFDSITPSRSGVRHIARALTDQLTEAS